MLNIDSLKYKILYRTDICDSTVCYRVQDSEKSEYLVYIKYDKIIKIIPDNRGILYNKTPKK